MDDMEDMTDAGGTGMDATDEATGASGASGTSGGGGAAAAPAPDELAAGNMVEDDLPLTRRAAHVVSLASVASTNAVAERLVRDGSWSREGMTVVAAREQTAGRGRLDHTWFSEPGRSFTVSFVSAVSARVARDPSLNGWLQIIAGLSVLDALRETLHETNLEWVPDEQVITPMPEDVLLKWPNDIVYHGRKLGGILARMVMVPDCDVVAMIFGVGLNLDVREDQLPTEEATSWQLVTRPQRGAVRPETAREADLIASRIVARLSDRLWLFGEAPERDARNLLRLATQQCWTLGRPILVHYMDGTTEQGIARALTKEASLAMTGDDGLEKIVRTGDVGVLPVGD